MKKISLLLICLFLLMELSIAQESYIDSTKIKDPKLAWKLSILPGLGQIYNGKYVKAAILALGQTYVVSKFHTYESSGSIGKRNTYAWWIAGLMIYSMLDAYVDAQLSTFPVKTEPDDAVENEPSPPEAGDAQPDPDKRPTGQ
ncbi:MAG: hypothetical protein GXO91_06125 [FCB group bacterium]|nr:hypothetical protein [FCB group bacterium]